MATTKRARTDSIRGQTEQFRAAVTSLEPPLSLLEAEMIYFEQITKSREIATWSENDLVVACNLAKTYRRLDELNFQLDVMGYTQTNERGTVVANPIFSALTQIQSQVQALNRTLGLGASQRGISGGKQAGRNEAERDARRKASDPDDLLA